MREAFLRDLACAGEPRSRVHMASFIKVRKRKKKQSSFTTLHGILLSLAIAAVVGLIFGLVVVYYHSPPD